MMIMTSKGTDRLAWIVRWVNGKQDYFVDTSGLRRTARMMEVYGDDIRVDDAYPDRVRENSIII